MRRAMRAFARRSGYGPRRREEAAMTGFARCLPALAVSLVLSLVVGAKAWSSDSARLKLAVLPSPGTSLSRSDAGAAGGYRVRIYKGVVYPKGYVSFGRGSSGKRSISIGGNEYAVHSNGSGRFSLVLGSGRSVTLKGKGRGCLPQMIALPDKRRYVLAFPISSRSTIYYRSGCLQKGRIWGQDVRLYDDNTDGFYTMAADAIQVGNGPVFAPISELVAAGSSVYKIEEIARDGSTISYSKHDGETGQVSVRHLAAGLTAHIAFGSGGAKLNFVSNCKGKPLTVVPGKYALLYGIASDFKGKPMAGVVAGNFEGLKAASGRTEKQTLGAPFNIEFTVEVQGRKISISPSSIRLFGKAGEEYVSFNFRSAPTITVLKNGRAVHKGRMTYS